MPFKRTRRSLARLLALALCLFNSSLLIALAGTTSSSDLARSASDGEIAVIDALVVGDEKKDSVTPDHIFLVRAGTTTPIGVNVGDKLYKDDELTTKDLGQVTLRFVDVQNGELNLVYLDNNSQIHISSACLKSGRIFGWVGINFQFCFGNTNVAVTGTQFVIDAAENPAAPKVTVLEGEVTLKPKTLEVDVEIVPAAAEAVTNDPPKVKAKEEAVITPTSVTKTELPEQKGRSVIDYWSRKMIKADPKQASDSPKVFKNYLTKEDRDNAFITARFEALWNNDPIALETVAKVYNDWNRGDKATEVLQVAANRDAGLRTRYDFQINLAEADRLSERYASAISNAKRAQNTRPNDDRAAYIGGKAAFDSYRVSQNGADLDTARQFLSTALQKSSEQLSLNKEAVERELNEVIKENADRYKQVAIGYDNPLDCAEGNSVSSFSGNVRLPELDARGLAVSGRGTLSFLGNQFKLISKVGKVFTGTFTTQKFRTYTSVVLRFDSPSVNKQDGITVSLKGQGNCNRLDLQRSKPGGILMTALKPIDSP